MHGREGCAAGHPPVEQSQQACEKRGLTTVDAQSPDSTLQNFILPLTIDESMFVDFLNEQGSILDKAEGNILSLEKSFNKDVLDDVRRIFHTMKSESAVFEIANIAHLCHGVEDLFDSQPTEVSIDKLFLVIDWLKYAFDCLKTARMLPDVPEPLRVYMTAYDTCTGRPMSKLRTRDRNM